jgi:hypothetical protein
VQSRGLGTSDVRADLAQPPETLATHAYEQVRAILGAAEAEAHRIRERAKLQERELEEKALRRLEEADSAADAIVGECSRRILELADLMVKRAQAVIAGLEQAEAVKRQLEILIEALRNETMQAVEKSQPTSSVAGHASVAPPAPEHQPAEEGPGAPAQPGGGEGLLSDAQREEGARLVALQMAIAGSSRIEVKERLKGDVSDDSLEAILDEVFGARTAGNHRIAWRAGHLDDVA